MARMGLSRQRFLHLISTMFNARVDSHFAEMMNDPAVSQEVRVFASVFCNDPGKGMPVGAIALDRDSLEREGKIKFIASHTILGFMRHIVFGEAARQFLLKIAYLFAVPDKPTSSRAGLLIPEFCANGERLVANVTDQSNAPLHVSVGAFPRTKLLSQCHPKREVLRAMLALKRSEFGRRTRAAHHPAMIFVGATRRAINTIVGWPCKELIAASLAGLRNLAEHLLGTSDNLAFAGTITSVGPVWLNRERSKTGLAASVHGLPDSISTSLGSSHQGQYTKVAP